MNIIIFFILFFALNAPKRLACVGFCVGCIMSDKITSM
jgi:hypothetical protein